MKNILLTIAALFVIAAAYAALPDRSTLTGTVKDAATQQPLAGVTISLPDLKLSTVADASGNYIFNNLPSGYFIIEVSYAGYRTLVDHININGSTVKDFLLHMAIVEYENVTVTGVASATQLKKTPVQVSVISKKNIEQSTGTNLLDVAAKQPGVSIVTTGPAIAKPFIRGVGYNRVVSINDGIRQEGQQWGDEHGLEMDEYSAQKIEILRGPASLIYGSDAIGGVINILTNTTAPQNTAHINLSSSINANNRLWGHHLDFSGNSNGFVWNAYGSLKNAGDYSNKYDGSVLNSRFNEKNIGGMLGLNKRWGFSHFIFSRFDQHIGMIEGERDAQGHFVLDGYDINKELADSKEPLVPYQRIQHTKFLLDNTFYLGNTDRITVLAGIQRNQRQEFADVDTPKEPEAYFDLQTINYNLGYHFRAGGWKTSIGANGMQQVNVNRGAEWLIPNYDLFDIGAYATTSKEWGKATVSGGLRYDTRNLDSKRGEQDGVEKFAAFKKTFSNLSASLGLAYQLGEGTTFKANVARGFRAPNISELAANGEHEGTNRYEIGDPNLKSEISTAVDAGIEANTSHVSFYVAPFYNHINNYIFYAKLLNNDGSDSVINDIPAFRFNQQSATLAGIEARIDLHPHPLDWLHFENAFSFVRGKFTEAVDGSYNLPLIAPTSLLSELRAEFPSVLQVFSNLYAKLEMNAVAAQNNYFAGYNTETATKGYVLFNAGLGSDIKINNKQAFAFSVGLNNIGDVAYQSHLNRLKYTAENPATGRVGVFNMGRSFTARVIVPFEWKLKQ